MQTQPEEFPNELRNNPQHRANVLVFDALKTSDLEGWAAYYAGTHGGAGSPCIGVWAQGLARFAIMGIDRVDGGRWSVLTDQGWQTEDSPLQRAIDAANDVQRDICHQSGFSPYLVWVVVFVDMEYDPAVAELATRCCVHTLWDTHHIGDELEHVTAEVEVRHPPMDYQIRNELPPRDPASFSGQSTPTAEDLELDGDVASFPWLDLVRSEMECTLIYRVDHLEQHIQIQAPPPPDRPTQGTVSRRPRRRSKRLFRKLARGFGF